MPLPSALEARAFVDATKYQQYTLSKEDKIMDYVRFAWDRTLETGIAPIDNQHKQWIAAVNALFGAHQRGKGVKEVERTMVFFVEYTLKHFNDEEKIQEKYGYTQHLEHKQTHDIFKGEAQQLAAVLHREGPTDELITHICVTIGRWVIDHIKHDDFKMAAYIRDKEMQRSQPQRGWTRLYDRKN